MATQLGTTTDIQQQVYTGYRQVRLVIAKPILNSERAAFNQKLLQEELSPAWGTVFTQGRTYLNFPTHLISIIIQLKPAADQGRLNAIDAAAILPDDPKIQKTKAYQKGYIIPDSSVTTNLPISNNRWWKEFHQQYEAANGSERRRRQRRPNKLQQECEQRAKNCGERRRPGKLNKGLRKSERRAEEERKKG
ncbi:hypothetical protein HYDPIDRAFT_31456 [Hydnomerulius pinastri MD-312]|uniref:Uncharacterized protein n=1 Tax=Hydnomerulius pinastri MD-312 TaxID=994086 RepID=A0A0C9WBP1_9AGAM|nr:hypothetical protein HYDPIDRAFT_34864 [Hydnomerulius pinastri MD-312]KIJ61371.1 hypothetical protein HYDPIDRAFT_31456 [Hydnomerulius pinastri MD-312]